MTQPEKAAATRHTGPDVQAALTLFAMSGKSDSAIAYQLHEELAALMESGGDKHSEGTLIAQAKVLDSLFNHLMRMGLQRSQSHYASWEPIMRLALKAQSQCRVTLESLAALRNPQPVAYVQQANIAHTQQVNNP